MIEKEVLLAEKDADLVVLDNNHDVIKLFVAETISYTR
ncbi:hypothetical protein J2S25_001622 [Mesobacillus stamsii]|uniref:Uncharacterized protein n=1 Tax=Mesobacillus stamsii TaxID=225347 RepID=A0ABU0FU36_9BACI|nr:hypothetical protein [Mesobacillus stamsii]